MNGLFAFLASLTVTALGEMGGAHQFLVLGLAKKYKPYQVMVGLFLSVGVCLLAGVALGQTLAAELADYPVARLIAALAFVALGVWVMKRETPEDLKIHEVKLGVPVTSAMASFAVFLGGKTQLTAVVLAAIFFRYPLWVLVGAVTGVLLADGLTVLFGLILSKKIPYPVYRMVAGCVMMLSGLVVTVNVLYTKLYLNLWLTIGIVVGVALVATVLAAVVIRKNQ